MDIGVLSSGKRSSFLSRIFDEVWFPLSTTPSLSSQSLLGGGAVRSKRKRNDKTSLHYAARNGHNHIIDYLLFKTNNAHNNTHDNHPNDDNTYHTKSPSSHPGITQPSPGCCRHSLWRRINTTLSRLLRRTSTRHPIFNRTLPRGYYRD